MPTTLYYTVTVWIHENKIKRTKAERQKSGRETAKEEEKKINLWFIFNDAPEAGDAAVIDLSHKNRHSHQVRTSCLVMFGATTGTDSHSHVSLVLGYGGGIQHTNSGVRHVSISPTLEYTHDAIAAGTICKTYDVVDLQLWCGWECVCVRKYKIKFTHNIHQTSFEPFCYVPFPPINNPYNSTSAIRLLLLLLLLSGIENQLHVRHLVVIIIIQS